MPDITVSSDIHSFMQSADDAAARTDLGLGSADAVTHDSITLTTEATAPEFIGELRGAVIFAAQAGEALTKGDVVYVSGVSGSTPVVNKANNASAATMPAFGLAHENASINTSVDIVTMGTLAGLDTSSWSLGDTLYVNGVGILTNVKPTGEGNLVQNLGKVQRVHASSGSIKVGGAGRSNDTPNLNDGNIFIGNGSNQATTSSFTGLLTTNAATIKTAYESNADTNEFSDAEQTKLAGVETGATADQTGAEIKAAYEAEANTNAFTDAEQTKLAGIEAGATADQTAGEIEAAVNHDNLLGFVASEHIDWTAATDNLSTTGTVSVGTSPSAIDDVNVDGDMIISHTSTSTDDHALEVDVDAAGFGDVKAVDIAYNTGALAIGSDEAAILVNIDETSATGGDITALEVLATEGSADQVNGMLIGAQINPLEQLSGLFVDADSVDDNGTDQTTALSTGGAGNIAVFTNDNETMTIGNANKFEEIEFIMSTFSSGTGIKPTFEYSTGVGTWGTFTPVDGTNGCRNNGVIAWLDADIPTWAVGTGSEYLIRITRTQNSLATSPVMTKVQVVEGSLFYWDKNGDLSVNSIAVTGTIDGRDVAADGSKLDGIEALADVTDTASVTAAGALMDSEVDADIKTLSLPANTTISAFGATLVDDADAATARTTLGVDAAGTDNSIDVTLTGTGTYLSIAGQAITVDPITESDISDLGSYLTAESDTLDSVTDRGATTTNGVTVGSITINGEIVEEAINTASVTGAQNLDPSSGTIQRIVMSGNVTYTDTLVDGESITLHVDDGTAYTITWPTMEWVGGSAPTLDTTNETIIVVWKVNSTLYGMSAGVSS